MRASFSAPLASTAALLPHQRDQLGALRHAMPGRLLALLEAPRVALDTDEDELVLVDAPGRGVEAGDERIAARLDGELEGVLTGSGVRQRHQADGARAAACHRP